MDGVSDQTTDAPDLAALLKKGEQSLYALQGLARGYAIDAHVFDTSESLTRNVLAALRASETARAQAEQATEDWIRIAADDAANANETLRQLRERAEQAEQRVIALEAERTGRIAAISRGLPHAALAFIAENPKTAREHGLDRLLEMAAHRSEKSEQRAARAEAAIPAKKYSGPFREMDDDERCYADGWNAAIDAMTAALSPKDGDSRATTEAR